MAISGLLLMPKDGFGNEYEEMVGQSRRMTPEQLRALLARPHEVRGCCPFPPICCKAQVPGPVFTWAGPDRPRWTCPTCGTVYVWDDDEAEGGGWYPVVEDRIESEHG
jgi:hypothetical protein